MTGEPCSVAGCDYPQIARTWCSSHYARWRRHGDPLAARSIARRALPAGYCSIEGCDRPAHSRGWCRWHYERWREAGDPLGESRVRTCREDGCRRRAGRRSGLCGIHDELARLLVEA